MSAREPTPASAAIDLISRIVTGASTTDDVDRIRAACLARVLGEAESIDAALGLGTGWEKNARRLVAEAVDDEDVLAASEWLTILRHYLARHFATDRIDPRMIPQDRLVKFRMAVHFKGKVPGLRSMQRYLTGK